MSIASLEKLQAAYRWVGETDTEVTVPPIVAEQLSFNSYVYQRRLRRQPRVGVGTKHPTRCKEHLVQGKIFPQLELQGLFRRSRGRGIRRIGRMIVQVNFQLSEVVNSTRSSQSNTTQQLTQTNMPPTGGRKLNRILPFFSLAAPLYQADVARF